MKINPKRRANIRKASLISVLGNLFLAVIKIIVGFISGSLAVIGDGIDSSVDVLMSIITLFTARIMGKPPSTKYAYGYEKADSIAATIFSFLIFFAGAQLIISSVKRLISGSEMQIPSMMAIYVIIISIITKLLLSVYQYKVGKKEKSNMLIANAQNMKYDIFISLTVLVGLIFTKYLNLPIADPIAAFLVGLWILKGAYSIFMQTNTELMDGVNDPAIYEKIFKAVEEVEGVSNPHRVRSRQIGGMHMIVIDIEVDAYMPLIKAHDLANQVEDRIKDRIENIYDIVIHTEPYGNVESDEVEGITKNDL
jgi:cation diffusion facilitator family transporter